MSKWNELKRLAEAQPNKEWSRDAEGQLSCSSGQRMYGVKGPQCVSDFEDWGFTREAASFIAAANPAAILELIAENERLERKNANQCETIRHYQDQITGGDTSLTMLIAERDQMRELLMRLVDLQNSGRGPIRSYELWNVVVNEARSLLGLEARHV